VQLSFGGRLRFVYRHFPLTEIHPHAEIAAESAEFAGAVGMFWDMHDALFENQSRMSVATIFLIGEELGLPETAMRNALETGQFRAGSGAASTAHRLFSSMGSGTTGPTTTPRWCRESRCAPQPIRAPDDCEAAHSEQGADKAPAN
jgi:hypothetical protein